MKTSSKNALNVPDISGENKSINTEQLADVGAIVVVNKGSKKRNVVG